MSTRPSFSESSKFAGKSRPSPSPVRGWSVSSAQRVSGWSARDTFHLTQLTRERLSPWSQSWTKRLFDCLCVLLALPLLIPVLAVVALAVRLTSRGPVLFLQKRMGRDGRAFTILKFRTMAHTKHGSHNPVTTTENQRFTPVGPFLRRWKLDELPQLLNVLVGDMSMVGPRPKLLEHQIAALCCRPGITGAATIAFAREEQILVRLPNHYLDDYYSSVILPFKHQLDMEYMARANFLSDLKLILDSVLRRWDPHVMDRLLCAAGTRAEEIAHPSKASVPAVVSIRVSSMAKDDSLVSEDQFTQV